MSMTTIKTLLSQKIGIDFATVSSHQIERTVNYRLTASGVADLKAYLHLLQTSPQEFTELVEKIVVPETYFFRDSKSFTFLIDFVRTQWLSKPKSKFRLLSIPCSTGEEPYSMAIALIEAGLTTDQFQIDAIDISELALTKARQGIYGKNSFRGTDSIDSSKYFRQTKFGTEVSASVRNTIKFSQNNILTKSTFNSNNYDIIFCRNLLIYLHPAACESVFNTLDRLLTPQGLLFVASAESAKVPKDRFTAIRQSFTLAYQKNKEQQSEQNRSIFDRQLLTINYPPVEHHRSMFPVKDPIDQRIENQVTNIDRNSQDLNLSIARQLADEGQLDPAINYCQKYLTKDRTNIEVYILLATLYQGKNENNLAEKNFEKALYLDPNSHDALIHLALLKEHKGDRVGAANINQRIKDRSIS